MPETPTALIAAANRGVGLGVTAEFLARGWRVIATARRPDTARELRALAKAHPDHLTILAADMNDPDTLDACAASVRGQTLDAVLMNAGVSGPAHRSASQATEAEIGAFMMTNAIGPIRLARGLAPSLRRGTGVIGFSSSAMGSIALSGGGHELYRASKAALNALARGLWHELRGRGISVLSLHPGWVRTDMGGSAAPVRVAESARGIADLLLREQGKHRHLFADYKGNELAW